MSTMKGLGPYQLYETASTEDTWRTNFNSFAPNIDLKIIEASYTPPTVDEESRLRYMSGPEQTEWDPLTFYALSYIPTEEPTTINQEYLVLARLGTRFEYWRRLGEVVSSGVLKVPDIDLTTTLPHGFALNLGPRPYPLVNISGDRDHLNAYRGEKLDSKYVSHLNVSVLLLEDYLAAYATFLPESFKMGQEVLREYLQSTNGLSLVEDSLKDYLVPAVDGSDKKGSNRDLNSIFVSWLQRNDGIGMDEKYQIILAVSNLYLKNLPHSSEVLSYGGLADSSWKIYAEAYREIYGCYPSMDEDVLYNWYQ